MATQIIKSLKKWIAKYDSPRKELENNPFAAGEWLPMSEAPTDGTEILVRFVSKNGSFFHVVVRWRADTHNKFRFPPPSLFAHISPPKTEVKPCQ